MESKLSERPFRCAEAWLTLDNILGTIRNCDTKVSYLLGAMSILTMFELNLIDFDYFKIPGNNDTFWGVFLFILFLMGILSTITAITLSIYILSLQAKPAKGGDTGSKAVLNFDSIAQTPFSLYADQFKSITKKEFYHELLLEIYINSEIAKRKHDLFKINIYWFMASFGLLLMFIVFQNILF